MHRARPSYNLWGLMRDVGDDEGDEGISTQDDDFLPSREEGEETLSFQPTWNIVAPNLGLPH